jgi:hypothetical protein
VIGRLVIAGLVLALVWVAARAYRQWRDRLADPHVATPLRLPPQLTGAVVDDADGDDRRTWVVFTTPYCASCRPLVDLLRHRDPGSRVVTVDATAEPALARQFAVRSAPTTVLADGSGTVIGRFVGAEPVRRHVGPVASSP